MKTIYYAIQNIIRGKDSTLIKVVSLSLGLFFSIIIFAMVGMQLGFNSFYQDNENIYAAETAWDSGQGFDTKNYYCMYPTAKTLMEHFPEQIESATVIANFAPRSLQHGKEDIRLALIQADSLFFQTMGIPLVEGNALDLRMPDALFLSESTARRIFGSENPMGKTLRWQKQYDLIVKGIFADTPRNVTIHAEAVLSINHPWLREGMRSWMSGGNYPTFVRLKKDADVEYLNQRINPIIDNYLGATDFYKSGSVKKVEISLAPLKGYNLQEAANKAMVITLSILGLILLLTAAFNYALISISSLSHRAKAIGVHKCSGAETPHIFGMFLYETLFLTGISVLIAIFLILNFREQIATPFETLFALNNLWAPGLAIVLIFILGCVLPGRLFSSIPVTQVFRRYTEGKKRWKYPLLFVQFVGTAFLFGFVAVIYVQHHYVITKDMGYDSNRVVHVQYSFENPVNAMSNLRNQPYVEGVGFSMQPLLYYGGTIDVKVFEPNDGKKFNSRIAQYNDDFCRFMNIRLKAGKYHTNPNEILVNPAFVKAMGWAGDGVGEVVEGQGTVTGIVDMEYPNESNDFPYIAKWVSNEVTGFRIVMHARLKEPFEDNLIRLNEEMKKLYPSQTPMFTSYDQYLRDIFENVRTFRDSVLMACIAILVITLMGLIGYTNEEVRRRSKEIAIRKVNGAEVTDILKMLCQDVSIVALPAVVIGVLLSWQMGEAWISSNFEDILSISPLIYIGVVITALAFILGTVIVKSWRVANENPVLSIKSE